MNFFVHETAEDLYFSKFGTSNRVFNFGGKGAPLADNYKNAHDFARSRGGAITRDLRQPGGFAGAQPKTIVPKR